MSHRLDYVIAGPPRPGSSAVGSVLLVAAAWLTGRTAVLWPAVIVNPLVGLACGVRGYRRRGTADVAAVVGLVINLAMTPVTLLLAGAAMLAFGATF